MSKHPSFNEFCSDKRKKFGDRVYLESVKGEKQPDGLTPNIAWICRNDGERYDMAAEARKEEGK